MKGLFMNKKERFLTALKGGKPDRVPVFDFLEGKRIFTEILGKDTGEIDGKDIAECSIKLGFDAAFIAYGGFCNAKNIKPGDIYKDEWGVTYKNTGMSWPFDSPYDFPVKNKEDLKEWLKNVPDPNIPGRLDDIKGALSAAGNEIAIIGGVIGPITTAILSLGFEGTLMNMLDNPKMVQEVFEASCNFYNIAAMKMIDAGVDAIFVCEDLGFKTSLFVSPDIMRKQLFPYLFKQFDEIKKKKIPIMFHSDGNINEVVDDLIKAGISALHPLERKSDMDIAKVRMKYGNDICLVGNIDASDTLVYGSEDEIIKEVKKTIETAGADGAFILASDSDYHDGIPPENFIAMIKAAKKYGKYPVI
jgi:uroporphyrinogen decarboxylase